MFAEVHHGFEDQPDDQKFRFLHRNLIGLIDFTNHIAQRHAALSAEHAKLEATVKELTKTVEALQGSKA